MRRQWAVIGLAWISAITPSFHPALQVRQEENFIVVWVDDSALSVWRSDDPTPRQIVGSDVYRPFLSPGGTHVAYLSQENLWLSDVDGKSPREVFTAMPEDDMRRPGQVVWVGDTLYFNTLLGEELGMRGADDLWRVNQQTGEAVRLLADGEGGAIFPSPDNTRLALVHPGIVEYQPGSIAFFDIDTGKRQVQFTFPAVATGSEYRWYAQPRWLLDGSGVQVAIPPSGQLYSEEPDITALWRVPVDGDSAQMGSVNAFFFGLPIFSPDGAWVVYLQSSDNDLSLMLAASDGSNPVQYATGALGILILPAWLPEGNRFLFTQADPTERWLGQPGERPIPFPVADVSTAEVVWIDAQTYIISTQTESSYTLNWGRLGDPEQHFITATPVYPVLDAGPYTPASEPKRSRSSTPKPSDGSLPMSEL